MEISTPTDFSARVALGASKLEVSRIGLGSSYGLTERGVLSAFDHGINYFYWGSWRRASFGRGVRALAARQREGLVVCIQSYTRLPALLGPSVEIALRRLKLEYADLLLLGLWNEPPSERMYEAAQVLIAKGRARHVMLSCHKRATFARHFAEPRLAAVMTRYNAAHPGAEQDVFPSVPSAPTGIVAYTATCWGRLVDPARTPPGERTPRASDCYRFALTHPRVHMCLAGPKDEAQLEDAFEALKRGPLEVDELAWMKRVGAACR